MISIARFALAAVIAVPLAITGGMAKAGSDSTIVDKAASAGNFSMLLTAVKAAGLDEALKGDGPFTVFAPTDDAFKKLPAGKLDELLKPENKEMLASVLKHHVVPGKVMASEVASLKEARTVNGQSAKISMSGGSVMINGAKVVKTDIAASNGVIHVIDSVILPASK